MVTAFLAGRAYGEDKTRRPFQAGAQRIFVPQGAEFPVPVRVERHQRDTRRY